MRGFWAFYLLPLLLSSCGGGCGDESATAPVDEETHNSDLTLAWTMPDSLHNVFAPPYQLELRLEGDDAVARIGFEIDGEIMPDLAIPSGRAAGEPGPPLAVGQHLLRAYAASAAGDELAIAMMDVLVVDPANRHLYGGSGEDRGYGVAIASDGDLLLACDLSDAAGRPVGALINRGPGGHWFRAFRGEHCRAVAAVAGGGAWFAGYLGDSGVAAGTALTLRLLDQAGAVLHFVDKGGESFESQARSVNGVSSGGCIVAGETLAAGRSALLARFDAAGSELWFAQIPGGEGTSAHCACETAAGFALAGYQDETYGRLFLLLGTDADGNETWRRTYSAGGYNNVGRALIATEPGGLLAVGTGGGDLFAVMTDASGDEIWSRAYGENGWGIGMAVSVLATGGYLIAGGMNGDLCLIAIDGDGDEQWRQLHGGSAEDRAYALIARPSGSWAALGWTNSEGAGASDVWLLESPEPRAGE